MGDLGHGAIAARGDSDALRLYRQVVLASCAIPGFLPPVEIEVTIDGQSYREMHADGGTTAAVFSRPFMLGLDPASGKVRSPTNLYIVSTAGKLFADPECVERRWPRVAGNAITAML